MTQMRALNNIDFAVLTVAGTAVGLADATPALVNGKVGGKTVRRAFITVAGTAQGLSDTDVGWRADGTAPTAGSCHLLPVYDSLSLTGANYKSLLNSIKFIQITSTATIHISYFD